MDNAKQSDILRVSASCVMLFGWIFSTHVAEIGKRSNAQDLADVYEVGKRALIAKGASCEIDAQPLGELVGASGDWISAADTWLRTSFCGVPLADALTVLSVALAAILFRVAERMEVNDPYQTR